MKTLVIKLGGSLLSSPGLADRLADWLRCDSESQPRAKRVLLVGGGAAVDALREFDRVNPLDPLAAHWRAIDAMDHNARLVTEWLPDWLETKQLQRVRRDPDHRDWLFSAGDWLRRDEPAAPGKRLEASWRVTGDSIAARVAGVLGADLLLVKSRPPAPGEGPGDGWRAAVGSGYVDQAFPEYANQVVRVGVVSLLRHAP